MIEKLDGVELRVLRLALGCALALVVAALIARGLVPAYKEYSQLSHTQGVMQQLVSNEEGVASDRSRIQREIDDLATLVQGDFASLPAQELEAHIVERLQSISWRNDVELASLQPLQGVSNEQYEELVFQIELAGGYFHLVDWLRDLAAELGFVVVKEHQLMGRQSSDRKPQISAKLSLAAYRLDGVR